MKNLARKLILLLIVAAFSVSFAWWSETGRAWVRRALAPFNWVVAHVHFHPVQSIQKIFSTRRGLREQNVNLRQELFALRQELTQAREISKENERLRDLLQFQKELTYKTVPARVVGRDPTQWFRGITIDRGSTHGLKLNMPVVTHDGLVGRIVELSASMAQVQLIVDYGSRVGGLLQDSREVGILTGEGTAGCRLLYISRNAAIQNGETVLTSGVGSLYPKGLLVGKVRRAKLEKGGLYNTAKVDPAVDFGKLEEVMVLVSVQ